MSANRSIDELALRLQGEVFQARLDGLLGDPNDSIDTSRLALLVLTKLREWGRPVTEAQSKAMAENFPIIDVDPDDAPEGSEQRALNEVEHIKRLLAWAYPRKPRADVS